MNFNFSDDQLEFAQEIRRVLSEEASFERLRRLADEGVFVDRALWTLAGELGWLAIAVPEAHGGLGLGALELCLLAEECGRRAVALPIIASSVAAAAIADWGTPEQQARWLRDLSTGAAIASASVAASDLTSEDDRLTGAMSPVLFAREADVLLLRDRDGRLRLVETAQNGVGIETLASIDPYRPVAQVVLDGARSQVLGDVGAGELLAQRLAVATAFEQIGGCDASLEMATAYVQARYAFGRPLSANQAIKHRLADMLAMTESARSNAYYAAWAMDSGPDRLAVAAATARLGASTAFDFASRENLQLHGGMGFTWEADCHFFYKRAAFLKLIYGAPEHWADVLIAALVQVGKENDDGLQ